MSIGNCSDNSDLSYITGMVLPFEPLTLTFENVQYFVETSKVIVLFMIPDSPTVDTIETDQSSMNFPEFERSRFSTKETTTS